MTNKDWLNGLSDSEFAKWLKNEFSLTYGDYIDLVVWLSEEHKEYGTLTVEDIKTFSEKLQQRPNKE